MKTLFKSLAAIPMLAVVSQMSFAGAIENECDKTFETDENLRTATLTYETGSVVCGPSGNTGGSEGQPEGQYFTGEGYTELSKINFVNQGTDSNEFFYISGLDGTSGDFRLADGLTDITAVFKFGSGQSDPDWISFVISDITENEAFTSSWTVNPDQQALSHVTLWSLNGDVTVPEPGTAFLLATGIFGLVASRRRMRKAA